MTQMSLMTRAVKQSLGAGIREAFDGLLRNGRNHTCGVTTLTSIEISSTSSSFSKYSFKDPAIFPPWKTVGVVSAVAARLVTVNVSHCSPIFLVKWKWCRRSAAGISHWALTVRA